MTDDGTARELLTTCFHAGLAAVDPEVAVEHRLGRLPGRVVVFAIGKAAPAMARGAARSLQRDRLEGLVVADHEDEVPEGIELMLGGHPIPDDNSLRAGIALLNLAASLGPDDTALVLISGGGSALVEAPIPGIDLADLIATNRALLRSGADIGAVNTVRRRLSLIKGGGLAAVLAPARIVTLVVSDVVGDDPATIASGPTVAAADDRDAALAVITDLGLRDALPRPVVDALTAPRQPRRIDWRQEMEIVADGATAAHAAAAEAEQRGFPSRVLDTRMVGAAGQAAGEVLQRSRFGVSVFAGETTVEVTGSGTGGRNQQAALIAATLIEGRSGIWFLAAGTDGIDGTTNAAGAIVDGGTVSRAMAVGLDPHRALERDDSGGFFAGLGEQIVTGPTGTNVGDLWLVLRD